MDAEVADLLTELIEKVGLLRTDMKKKGDFEKYEARFTRIDQKLSGLAERIARDDAPVAARLQSTWLQPGRSLAFRNADHVKQIKETEGSGGDDT
jgi:hypothetical protein